VQNKTRNKACVECEMSLLCTSGSKDAPTARDKCGKCDRLFSNLTTLAERKLPAACALPDGLMGICNECGMVQHKPKASLRFKYKDAHGDGENFIVQVFGALGDSFTHQLAGELRLRSTEFGRLRYALELGDIEQDGKLKIEFEKKKELPSD
jgi:hypothetical protein